MPESIQPLSLNSRGEHVKVLHTELGLMDLAPGKKVQLYRLGKSF